MPSFPGAFQPIAQTSLPGPLSRGREGGKTGFAGRVFIETLMYRKSLPGTFAGPAHLPITVPPSFRKGVRGKVLEARRRMPGEGEKTG